MMRKLLSTFLLMGTVVFAHAQQVYKTEKAIRYYPETFYKGDSYKDSMCVLDLYYPEGAKNFATIVWLHGGGITGGSRHFPQELLNKGYAVATVEYRLSPRVKAPAYIEDAAAAIAWVFKNIGKYGGSDKLIFLTGHSAGGYLVTMATFDKKYLAKYDIDANKVAALVPFSAQVITHFTVRNERGQGALQPTIDSLAPLNFIRKDVPPTMLLTGDRNLEMLARYEENAYLWRMMKLAGVTRVALHELQGYDHGSMPEGAYGLLLAEMRKRIAEINGKAK